MTEHPKSHRVRLAAGLITGLVLATTAGMKLAQSHALKVEAARRKAELEAGPRVRALVAGSDSKNAGLPFQGEALPFVSATVYAKVSGFLKEVRVDKGTTVAKDQVLALVESAEVDRDTLALKADADNKQRDAERARQLGKQGILSAKDVDAAEAAAKIASEKLASQATLQGYKRVLAPFSGVVTERYADPGAMLQNGGNSSSAQPIVTVAQVDRLRITFYVDQRTASLVKPGLELDVRPADRTDLVRRTKVSRVAGALDARTRTMLAEAELDNRDGAFLAGSFVQVAVQLPDAGKHLDVPAEALLVRGSQAFAAIIGPDSRVHLQQLQTSEDQGSRVRVLAGLKAGDRIVINPSPSLKDGDRVQVVEGR